MPRHAGLKDIDTAVDRSDSILARSSDSTSDGSNQHTSNSFKAGGSAAEPSDDVTRRKPGGLAPNPSSQASCTGLAEDDRRCSHIRDDGARCRGWRVKGESLCAGHLKVGIAANPQEAGRLAAARSAEVRHDRAAERGMTLRDRLAQGLERNAAEIEDRLIGIIREGEDRDALRAISEWMNRVYGRPTERIEQLDVNTEPERVKQLRQMTREERLAYLRKLEARRDLHVVETEPT